MRVEMLEAQSDCAGLEQLQLPAGNPMCTQLRPDATGSAGWQSPSPPDRTCKPAQVAFSMNDPDPT
jgi:hypothetical protein